MKYEPYNIHLLHGSGVVLLNAGSCQALIGPEWAARLRSWFHIRVDRDLLLDVTSVISKVTGSGPCVILPPYHYASPLSHRVPGTNKTILLAVHSLLSHPHLPPQHAIVRCVTV